MPANCNCIVAFPPINSSPSGGCSPGLQHPVRGQIRSLPITLNKISSFNVYHGAARSLHSNRTTCFFLTHFGRILRVLHHCRLLQHHTNIMATMANETWSIIINYLHFMITFPPWFQEDVNISGFNLNISTVDVILWCFLWSPQYIEIDFFFG